MTRLASIAYEGELRNGVVDGDVVRLLPTISFSELASLTPSEIDRRANENGESTPLEEALLGPSVRPSRNVFCVGWNYLAHFEEGRGSRPEVDLPAHPTFFTKATTTLNGPYDAVPFHVDHTSQLDWEVELAIVIGTAGVDIEERNALDHVFGYTVANDVTARDVQYQHGQQWFKGKSLDGSLPIGPVLVTADEIPDPQSLAIECRVDGEVVQQASTAQMIFPIARIIAELSAGLTLLPGDVILTGTPEGIGHQRKPQRHLQAGEVLTSSVEGIGQLRNTIEVRRKEAS